MAVRKNRETLIQELLPRHFSNATHAISALCFALIAPNCNNRAHKQRTLLRTRFDFACTVA